MRVINIVVVGNGNIGRTLLRQIAAAAPALRETGSNVRVVGVVEREMGIFALKSFTSDELQTIANDTTGLRDVSGAVRHSGWQDVQARIEDIGVGSLVIVDVTAEDAAVAHLSWLRKGWRVVTSNKKPITSPSAVYAELMIAAAVDGGTLYRHETTVGAGLPIVSTLHDMLATGDSVLEIRAAVSGTLGFVFSSCENGMLFADAVREAKNAGFTEPDPRDDLGGTDVARKALILGRLIGWKGDLADIAVESLVPSEARSVSKEEFMTFLPTLYEAVDRRFSDAASRGIRLRYLATVTPQTVRVGIEEVAGDNPFASLSGSENMFVFRTKRYDTMPLIVRGPGAGAEVTAAGVFADILRVAL